MERSEEARFEEYFQKIASEIHQGYRADGLRNRLKNTMHLRIKSAVEEQFDLNLVEQNKEMMRYLRSRHLDSISSVHVFDTRTENLLFVEIGRRCQELELESMKRSHRISRSQQFAEMISLDNNSVYEENMRELIESAVDLMGYGEESSRKIVRDDGRIFIETPRERIEVPKSCHDYLQHMIEREERIKSKANDISAPRKSRGPLGLGF